MKILSLDLIAFGPFTGTVLDLSAGREGLHIVYGANEAGKSSALRGLRQLLYGIPERSSDGFVHPYSKMRIGGRLRSAAGEVLEVVRRKGRDNTLREADDTSALAESALQSLLNRVEAGLFATMFGIGYEELVEGGREIVQGGGDVGRLVFAAGSGVAHLGAVLKELQVEADALFRFAGKKQAINEAVGRLKQHRDELNKTQLPGQEWARRDQALKAALEAKAGVETGLARVQRGLSRLLRIQEALPVIAGRREAVKALESVADAVLLPEDFGERRSDALTRWRVAQSERNQAAADLVTLGKALSELEDPSVLLGHAEAIEGLHQELGSRRKAAKDCIGLETRRNTLSGEARQILRNLRVDLAIGDAETLRIGKPEAVRIQELGAEFERIATRIDATREKIPEQERALADASSRIETLRAPRPIDELKRRLAEAEEALPLERQLVSVRMQLGELRQDGRNFQARLGLTAVRLEDLVRLAAPSMETVGRFEDRQDGLDRRLTAIAEEFNQTEADLAEIDRRLDEARLMQEVPTEADLAAIRESRDRGWRMIRRTLEGPGADPGEAAEFTASYRGAASLPEAFEVGLRRADETADRLRREAERVAAKARLLADQTAFRQRLAQIRNELWIAQRERQATEAEWSVLWQPLALAPRSPREMRQWLTDFKSLVEKASAVLKREAEAAALEETVAVHRSTLRICVQAFSGAIEDAESLSVWVRRARQVIDQEEGVGRQVQEFMRERMRLAGELDAARSKLKTIEADHRRWQGQWERALQPLGLGAGTRPAEANAVMEELKSFFDKLREAEVLQQRIAGIDRDAELFGRNVAALTGAVAPDLTGRPAEEAASELQRRLTAGREMQSRRQTLKKQIEQAEARRRNAESATMEMERLQTAMCAEARCLTIGELSEAERRSARRRQLEAQLQQQEDRLLHLCGGSALEDFIQAASALDPDGIGGDIERLSAEIDRLTAEKSDLDQRIGSERTELGRMDGGDKAARIAEEMQSILGGLERDVEQYARLKIAGRILAMAMERFQEKSQGPILRRASELFRRITCGSFDGLRADHDADGNPVIVGVRPGGRETLQVDGMSDGTADQLYLALRLAGIEHYLDANEPMPFVVDDILIKFDNDRAAAALQALSELSKRTQVIFFTHHAHLLDIAKNLSDPELLVCHNLCV